MLQTSPSSLEYIPGTTFRLGLDTTSASDQVKMLKALVYPSAC